jgi:hypothetical protein
MRLRLFTLAALLTIIVVACQGPPPTMFVLVVTATSVSDPSIATPAATAPAAVTGTTTSTTPSTPSTPTTTPTLDPFPTLTVNQIQVAEQRFEHGRMFWLRPVDQTWIMMNGTSETSGKWAVYDDTFEEGQPEFDARLVPPTPLYQPERGFGKLWRENPEIKQALGWAIETEFGHVTRYEYHAGGTVNAQNQYVKGPGYHILVSLYGDVFRFNEDDSTWEHIGG